MKWPPERNLHSVGDTPAEITARERRLQDLRKDFATGGTDQGNDDDQRRGNPRGLGLHALGPTQFADSYLDDGAKVTRIHGNPTLTAKEFDDSQEAVKAAMRKIQEETPTDPAYHAQFMPPKDAEPMPRPPTAAPTKLIDEIPRSLGDTPPAGNLRSVPDLIEGAPGGLPEASQSMQTAAPTEMITGIPRPPEESQPPTSTP